MFRLYAHPRNPEGGWATDVDPWERISLYESRDLVARRFHERHGRDASDAKCREIASHLLQGRQYFASARGAGELVRPLLLYYGVVALSRGLILFLNPLVRESELTPSHGVKTVGWSTDLSGEQNGPARIPELRLRFASGTFAELAATTVNAEQTQVSKLSGPAPVTWGDIGEPAESIVSWIARGTDTYPKGAAVELRQVLARLPDLAVLFEDVLAEPTSCYRAAIAIIESGTNLGIEPQTPETWIDLYRTRLDLPSASDLADALGIPSERLSTRPGEEKGLRQVALTHASAAEARELLPPVRTDVRGYNHLVAPLPDSLVLSTLSLLYLASYASGMLVRYHPTSWQAMSGLRIGDRAFPLLKAAVSLVERRFPIEVLDRLEREWPFAAMIEQPLLSGNRGEGGIYMEFSLPRANLRRA